jgi:hypothetical protein
MRIATISMFCIVGTVALAGLMLFGVAFLVGLI